MTSRRGVAVRRTKQRGWRAVRDGVTLLSGGPEARSPKVPVFDPVLWFWKAVLRLQIRHARRQIEKHPPAP